ncbi:von Willebrand factor A domain-containing protein 5B1 isoform X2 [Rattus norvegicus]|uniref:von Willebrand factor A domain containing 5B1 n=1 Tax=Rattus norvegicus TaxID=10116 RepID=A0A8I6ADZ4_RAT|nr:von Willebrand factor A domain-containing protein 5B1 isoform X2 [Rattus norvegicus]|eukprot:XP_006239261.1 PREDICTED: von Willebrand factor A domain-containing protein 5B1 isoform X1 [Rattus norvegicus]
MPGLLNCFTGAALPLTASDVTSYVSGYALGLTASLTYGNLEAQPFQGLFVYPTDECTTVVGFEAVIADRVVTIQLRDKAKLDRSYLDVQSATVTGNLPEEEIPITPGKVTLDEDLERILFVVNLGTIAPMENVTIFISTSSELPTLPSGAVRVLLPAICAPTVHPFCAHRFGSSRQQPRGKDPHCFGTQSKDSYKRLCLATLLDTKVTNPMEYEFKFQLEIRGPCLLAGVESPTHEIRADAAPSAHSAKSIIITLAKKHTFDRPVEILLHPSEPHMPHVLVEKGDMTLGEFYQHLKRKADFVRGTKKDNIAERKTEVIRKRLHKDIPHHSVIMLNFCPDLESVQPNPRRTHGEFIFLIDRSSSMSKTNIQCIKEAMLVALKSLMPACLFNVIGFGSTFKTVFASSQIYNEENLALACECIQRMRADMGGTNIFSPLKWVLRQPLRQGHPRLLFLITDGSVNNTGKVLELVRNHASSIRCYSFGIGPTVCYRLVKGLASVSKGSAEFLMEGERLQPKMVKSLKKAMAPVLSDVTVEWVFPETTEALISPVSTSSLFPGERLVGYGIVCDASLYISNSRSDKRRKYGMLHAQESSSSVFYHSQDEGLRPGSGNCAKNFNQGQTKDAHPCNGDSLSHHGLDGSRRRRAYSTNQISSHKACSRATTASDPTGTTRRYPLRKAKVQDLAHQSSSESQQWQIDLQPLLTRGHDPSQGPRLHGPGARRPSLLPQGCQPMRFSGPEPQAWSPVRELGLGSGRKSVLNSRSSEDLATEPPPFPSTLEPETSSDLEPTAELEEQAPYRTATPSPVLGKVLVKGVCDNQHMQWEVSFELEPPALRREDTQNDDMWGETFHHLAARAIIREFEHLAQREDEIELGSNRRYQVNAVHTSKACNVISKYTAFVPVDINKRQYLPTVVKYHNSALHESLTSTFNKTPSPGHEKYATAEGPPQNLSTSSLSSTKASEAIFGSRLILNKSRLLTRATKNFLSKSLPKAPEVNPGSQSSDYVPLVSLQLASGAFLLNEVFCRTIQIPMEKLKWTSPFNCLRMSLVTRRHDLKTQSPGDCTSLSSPPPPSDDISLKSGAKDSSDQESSELLEHTGKLWATVVALAWLEHSSASYIIEWELVAAKASSWVELQEVPEGRTLSTIKATARQLFVLLRHWDENLEFNMLCYNPNYM